MLNVKYHLKYFHAILKIPEPTQNKTLKNISHFTNVIVDLIRSQFKRAGDSKFSSHHRINHSNFSTGLQQANTCPVELDETQANMMKSFDQKSIELKTSIYSAAPVESGFNFDCVKALHFEMLCFQRLNERPEETHCILIPL